MKPSEGLRRYCRLHYRNVILCRGWGKQGPAPAHWGWYFQHPSGWLEYIAAKAHEALTVLRSREVVQ